MGGTTSFLQRKRSVSTIDKTYLEEKRICVDASTQTPHQVLFPRVIWKHILAYQLNWQGAHARRMKTAFVSIRSMRIIYDMTYESLPWARVNAYSFTHVVNIYHGYGKDLEMFFKHRRFSTTGVFRAMGVAGEACCKAWWRNCRILSPAFQRIAKDVILK
jgi:hypothetical protein